jgi:hypothetical protein
METPKWIVSTTVSGKAQVTAKKFAELADASPRGWREVRARFRN